ncbi:MAG TPA: Rap1a/Tai family immunity protein [Rhizomicrobium sp.]|nr:Rap1a/Tai family immunity protein [Rhizomicrobium sp.]
MRMAAFAAGCAAISLAWATAAGAATGNDLYKTCGTAFRAGFLNRGACRTYVNDAADALEASHAICPGQGVTIGQLIMVVQAYMRNHPEALNEDAKVLIAAALRQAFPCRP